MESIVFQEWAQLLSEGAWSSSHLDKCDVCAWAKEELGESLFLTN